MAQNSFQELHSAKVDTAWGTNHSPNVSAQESLACLFSPLLSLKPTPNGFSFGEKVDLHGKALFAQAPATHP